MAPLATFRLCAGLVLAAVAQGLAQPITIQSRSGQFHVQGPASAIAAAGLVSPNSHPTVRLDPSLLAVSCEHIKRNVLSVLEAPDEWRFPVFLRIQPGTTSDHPVYVEAVRYLDGWRYKVQLPEEVERDRLVETMVELLVLEMAQRYGNGQATELPPWLGIGLTEMIRAETIEALAFEPSLVVMQRQHHAADPLLEVRRHLQSNPPLPLDDLNWPLPPEEGGPPPESYRHCAHLLVHELLRLRGGTEAMQVFLRNRHKSLNWQTAFLESFKPHFNRTIDLDKWWSLLLVHVAGRDLSFTWSLDESWEKLDEALATPVQVRTRSNELPMTTRVSLQSLITEWDYPRQLPILRVKLNHLQALRLRASPELMPLVDGYRNALLDYVERRSGSRNRWLAKALAFTNRSLLVEETVERLNDLDGQAREMRRLLALARNELRKGAVR